MADTKIRINGLVHASSAELTDRFPIDNEDGITQSVSGQNIADMVATTEFDDLDTEDKTLKGAINELAAGGGGGGSSTFAGLTDVSINEPADGQVPKYNATTQKWENANESGGGSTVSITPILVTGTQIATFSIDGQSGVLYAPAGGGSSTVFVITQTASNPDTYDKTAQEIYDAVSSKGYSFMFINGSNMYYSTKAVIVSASKAVIYFDTQVTDVTEGSGTQTVNQFRLDVDTSLGILQYESLFESLRERTAEGTLTAGQTSITISNCSGLSADSMVDVYATIYGVSPTNVVVNTTAHTVALTFEAQSSDMGVKVRWSI